MAAETSYLVYVSVYGWLSSFDLWACHQVWAFVFMAECLGGTWCILCGQHSESITAVMRSWTCRPRAILNPKIWLIWPSLDDPECIWRKCLVWIFTGLPSILTPIFLPLASSFLSSSCFSPFSIRYLYFFFTFFYCLHFYISSDFSMLMSVLNFQTITGPHLPFPLVKITVLCWYINFISNSWLTSNCQLFV
jgi:hypothetical protein